VAAFVMIAVLVFSAAAAFVIQMSAMTEELQDVAAFSTSNKTKMIGRPIVVMGVSGSGKSTVGALLAERLRFLFVEGDDLHPIANKQKMARAIPLDDDDRRPWLDAIAAILKQKEVVVSCSALKHSYRDRLRNGLSELYFIYLSGSREILHQRLILRGHEFMPPALLDSQLATLEPPGVDECALTIDINAPVGKLVDLAADWLILPNVVDGLHRAGQGCTATTGSPEQVGMIRDELR
jgi:gluconokinase